MQIDRSADAREVVARLPTASQERPGIPVTLCSEEGTRALANDALGATGADLVDTHRVIAHLPETEGGVRNRLITAYYAELAQRAEAVFAGDLAGHPDADGHPGANWLWYAPWASDQVRELITTDYAAFGVGEPLVPRQAAADGNQVIFGDVGARFTAFVDLYERQPRPSATQLEAFFAESFRDGDAQIRNGFVAYVGAIEETDPARRQQLVLQGNVLVALHEQALAQPKLEGLAAIGPGALRADKVAERYLGSITAAAGPIDADDAADDGGDRKRPPRRSLGERIDRAVRLVLDPAGQAPEDLGARSPGATRFSRGPSRDDDVVGLDEIAGIDAWDDGFPTSTGDWHPRPDDDRTDGNSWIDPRVRMWFILRIFERHHTNGELYRTDEANLGLRGVSWLDPATGLR